MCVRSDIKHRLKKRSGCSVCRPIFFRLTFLLFNRWVKVLSVRSGGSNALLTFLYILITELINQAGQDTPQRVTVAVSQTEDCCLAGQSVNDFTDMLRHRLTSLHLHYKPKVWSWKASFVLFFLNGSLTFTKAAFIKITVKHCISTIFLQYCIFCREQHFC